LGIERIHLRRAAVHVEKDDVPGARRKMAWPRREWRRTRRRCTLRLAKSRSQRHDPKTHAALGEHFAPRISSAVIPTAMVLHVDLLVIRSDDARSAAPPHPMP